MTEQVLPEVFDSSFDSDLIHADILLESDGDAKYAKESDEPKQPRDNKGRFTSQRPDSGE